MTAPAFLRGRAFAGLAVLALFAAAVPAARSACSYLTPVSSQLTVVPTSGNTGRIPGAWQRSAWMVTAVSGLPGEDWDLGLYQLPAAEPACVQSVLATSTYGGNSVDFVIGDGTVNPHADVYEQYNRYSGTLFARAVWRDAPLALVPNGPGIARSWSSDSLIDLYQTNLTAGVTYTIAFSPTTGLGATAAIFRNAGGGTYWAGRSAALASFSATGTFAAPASGSYAIVVTNDGHASGTYTLQVGDCRAYVLTSGVPVFTNLDHMHWQFTPDVPYWTVAGIRPVTGDCDMTAYAAGGGAFPACLTSPLASSNGVGTTVDFVIGDFNFVPTATTYAYSYRYLGSPDAWFEWDTGADQVLVDHQPIARTVASNDVLEVWDLYLESGKTYNFLFDPAGTYLRLLMFRNTSGGAYWTGRWWDAVLDLAGPGTYTAPASGYYGLVVTHEDASAGSFTLAVSAVPCAIPATLARDVPQNTTSPESYYQFTPVLTNWTVMAARGGAEDDDWDLAVSTLPSGNPYPTCIGPILASSGYGPRMVDLVAFDFNTAPPGTRYARAHHSSPGSVPGYAEWDAATEELTLNAPYTSGNMTPADLVDVYEAWMNAGTAYRIDFNGTYGGLTAVVFENPYGGNYVVSRAGVAGWGTGAFDYTPTVTGYHAIAILNDGAVEANVGYFVRFGLCAPSPLPNCERITAPYAYSTFSFQPQNARWMAVGMRSLSKDWDIGVSASPAPTFPFCTGSPIASSILAGTNFTEFLVADFNHTAPGATYYADVHQRDVGPAVLVPVEFCAPYSTLYPNDPNPLTYVTGANYVVSVFDVNLVAGTQYHVDLTTDGGPNLHAFLFRNPGSGSYWANRSNAVLELSPQASSWLYTPPATDTYGVVVVNDDGVPGGFKLTFTYCPTPVALTSGSAVDVDMVGFESLTQNSSFWTAVGVRSNTDWDLQVYRQPNLGAPGTCFSGLLAASTQDPPTVLDFVVGDFNSGANSKGTYYVRPVRQTGTATGKVEWFQGGQILSEGATPDRRTTDANDVLEIWDVFMGAGQTYGLYFTRNGSADVKALLFRNPGGEYWAPRSARVLEATGHASYTAPSSGWYAVVVVNDNGLGGSYEIGLQPAGLDAGPAATPSVTALRGAAPNPSRGDMQIEYALHEAAPVRLEVLDMAGRRVATLEDGERPAGTWRVPWSSAKSAGGAVPPGLYFVRLQVSGRTVGEKKVALVQ